MAQRLLFLFLWTYLSIAAPHFLSAQSRKCLSHDNLQEQLREDPTLQDSLDMIERHNDEYNANPPLGTRSAITIPVVVHIVYKTNSENITEAQIKSQLAVLNKDFRKLNSEVRNIPAQFAPLAADAEINFQLAVRDPFGNATTGITRTPITQKDWSATPNDVKRPHKGGVAPWDATQYLNLWVCNLGSGLLGFAQFPGGDLKTDGVVVDYRHFGTINTLRPYNGGRTLTHEIGHWLNLHHIWGDATCGNDHVADTPQHKEENTGVPAFPKNVTCNGKSVLNMTMNFMDYVDDEAMSMFTKGQKERMWAVLAEGGARAKMKYSEGLKPPSTGCKKAHSLTFFGITSNSARLAWLDDDNVKNYILEYQVVGLKDWTAVPIKTFTHQLLNLKPSTEYQFRIKTICTEGEAITAAESFMTQASLITDCSEDTYEPNDGRTQAKTIVPNTTYNAAIGKVSDKDWFKITTTPDKPNIRVTLSNLTQDYDLKLYNAFGEVLATSDLQGLENEWVTTNGTGAATYFIQVGGGAKNSYHASQCYSLTIQTSTLAFRKQSETVVTPTSTTKPPTTKDSSATKKTDVGAFKIYPNPAFDEAMLEVELEKETELNIRIATYSGALVGEPITKKMNKGTATVRLDLEGFASGLYIVILTTDGKTKTQKISVQHE